MWYFAYGSNLNAKAVADWCKHYQLKAPALRAGRPAVLDNYRLSFSLYSEYWGGGTADIVYDPGKYVAGVAFDLSEADLAVLDQKVGRKLDASGKEVGVYARVKVKIAFAGKGEPVEAITYQGTRADRDHIAPTQNYMDLLIEGACEYGLSMMWVSYLQSFSTQGARLPKPPVKNTAKR